ncbi:MAG: hypothetical protein JST93_15185 [Acidobacteria bacterium]|nr:hypothetical protein [Acidobacteriota bacterium]
MLGRGRMWRQARVAAGLLLVSCGQHVTWTSKTHCVPSAEECSYRLTTTVAADASKGYANRNRKEVTLFLGDKDGRELLRRSYAVEAGELESAVRWEESVAEVVLYERRDGGLRQVLSVQFRRDSAGKFDEAAAPEWTGAVVQQELGKANARQTIRMDFRRSDGVKKMAVERVAEVAGASGLSRPEQRAANTLAAFEGEGIRLEVVEFSKEEMVRVRLESDAHREKARRIWTGLSSLPGGTVERTIVMTMPTGRFARAEFLGKVDGIARSAGLRKTDSCAEAYLACYSDGGIEIRPWTRFTETELSVMFVEEGWTARGDEVERALREGVLGR